MIMSLSFKAKEEKMWDYVQGQFDAAYYIKMLIFNDMNSIIKVQTEKATMKIEESVVYSNNSGGYADIDI